tara:strand:- start:581 stop:727 length:147 start_codon:yes stop_codon:yes gene_type:complete
MKKSYLVYILWLICVVIWNFSFPYVAPIHDVVAAILLSIFANQINKFI